MKISGFCSRVRGTVSGIGTLGAALRVDGRLIHVHRGSFGRKVTASSSIMSTRIILSGIGATFLLTCCRCSITLTGLLSVYNVPRTFRRCQVSNGARVLWAWGHVVVSGSGGCLTVSFVMILVTMVVLSFINVFLLGSGPIVLRKRVRTARVHVSKGLPNHVSAFLMRRKRGMGTKSALIIVGDPRTLTGCRRIGTLRDVTHFRGRGMSRKAHGRVVTAIRRL